MKAGCLLTSGFLCLLAAESLFGAQISPEPGVAGDTWEASTRDLPVVVTAAKASPPMAFAAAELKRYLQRILGKPLPAASGDKQRPVIVLSTVTDSDLTDEGYELRAEGKTFHIVGGGDLGLVFGAYEFLRRYGGCRFSDYGPDGEYVPRKTRIVARASPLRRKPKLWYRGLQFFWREDAEFSRRRIDWMAKNGFNYVVCTPWSEEAVADDLAVGGIETNPYRVHYTKRWFDRELRPAVRKRGLKLDMNIHNLLFWLPPARYLEEHPEWYAEIDGQRGKKLKQLCLCTSNAVGVGTLIENVRTYLRDNPEVKIVGIIPEDGYGMCQCERCVAGDVNPKDAFRKHSRYEGNRSKSNRYARLINAVAVEVREEFPDVRIGGAAYVDLLYPPRDVTLETNTTFWVAMYWRDGCHPLASTDTSEINKRFVDILAQWEKAYSGRLIVYEYYMGMTIQSALPYPMGEVICEDWKSLKRLGVGGATIQCRTSNHSVYALNNLAFARCAWEDDVDHDEVLDDYLLGAYGSASEAVRPIFEGLIQAMRERTKQKEPLLPDGDNIRYFQRRVGTETFHRALKAARVGARDDRERRQVERLAAAVHYWRLAADWFQLRTEAGQLRKHDPEQARSRYREALEVVWPQLRTWMDDSMPPGWLGLLTRNQWKREVDKAKKACDALPKT